MKVNPYEGCGGGSTTVKIMISDSAGSVCNTKAIRYPTGERVVWKSAKQLKDCGEKKFNPQSIIYYTIKPTNNNMDYCIDEVAVIFDDHQLTKYTKKTDNEWRKGTSETFVLGNNLDFTSQHRILVVNRFCCEIENMCSN